MQYQIEIRGAEGSVRTIDAAAFDDADLRDGDRLAVMPADAAAALPVTWGDRNVPIAPGHAIRVPEVWRVHD